MGMWALPIPETDQVAPLGSMANHEGQVLGSAGHGAANAHDELDMGVAGDVPCLLT